VSSPGITYTATPPVAVGARLEETETARELWHRASRHDRLGETLIQALREALPTETHAEAVAAVDDGTETALLAGGLVLGRWSAYDRLRAIGAGGSAPALDVAHALCHVAGDGVEADAPTVAIALPQAFRETDPRTRTRWCRTVAALGQVADVHLVASRIDQLWLADHHREVLPGVSEACIRPQDGLDTEAALEVAAPGTRGGRLLRALGETDTETLAYTALYSQATVSTARVRQVIGELADAGLVRPFGSTDTRRVELTEAGREFYETEIAVQRRLSDRVSEPRKLSNDSRVIPRTHGEAAPPAAAVDPGAGDRHRLPRLHDQRYLGRRDATAALGAADPGSIAVVDYPVEPQSDRAEGRWHADEDRLVVSCEADSPLTLWTTLALTLADRRTFDRVLTESRLEKHDVLGMLTEGKSVLRGMRTIGWLPSEVTDYDELVDAVFEAAEDLGELTQQYCESDDDALRSTITRHALGLAGSLTQLCDLADVEVVRLVKLPEFTQRFTDERAAGLWRSLAIGSAIGSSYGHHTVYRQLFETRDDKRTQAFEPTVDAANPTARLTGSWVLAGDFSGRTEQVAEAVETAFSGLDPHEDAPEIRLRCTVHTRPTRRQVAETTRRMLATKELEPTPEAVSLLHALARTPFDVAAALERLAGDNEGREVDIAEVRYALTTLESGRLLRGYDNRCTTPRRLLAALLDATTPLTSAGLAEAAGVSRRSLREHLDDLEAIGLVEPTDTGRYELALSTTDADRDRYADRTPWWVQDPTVTPEWRAAARAVRIGRRHHGSGEDVDAPGWPYEGLRDPPDLRELRHPDPWLSDLAAALWGLAERAAAADCVPAPTEITAGPRVAQTPLQDAAGSGEVVE